MRVQTLPIGKISAEYGEAEPYQSALKVTNVNPNLLIYSDAKTGKDIGTIYRTMKRWWVDVVTIDSPVEIPDKYTGFLFIQQVHTALKNNEY